MVLSVFSFVAGVDGSASESSSTATLRPSSESANASAGGTDGNLE